MPYCINCGNAQSKLNGGTLCKTCFNANNKGSVRSKDTVQTQEHNGNNYNPMDGDITELTSINADSRELLTPQELFEENFLKKSLTELNVLDLVNMIHTISSKTVIPEIHNLTKDFHTIKTELKNTKNELVKAQQDIVSLKTETKSLAKELNTVRETTNNNVKYLINHDRNVRRKNIMLFGVPENTDIVQDSGVSDTNDAEKLTFIFNYVGVNEIVVESHFRLGRKGQSPQKPLPIKVILNSGDRANDVFSQSEKLKSYKTHNIYIKPDKSKSEQKESHLGNRKKELVEQNPTVEGQDPRVKLDKGVLKLDNVEFDRYSAVQSLF